MIPYPQVLSRIPFEDLEALDDFSVRFVYPRPREVPRHWAMLLERSPRLDRLEPDDPDRAQVLGRFEGLRHALYQSFEQGKGSALFTTAGIDHPGRWRDVLVAHYCRPRWLYTNAQRVFSLVVASSGHHRVVELPSLSSLHEFRTLDIRELPDAEQVVDFGHLDAAEAHVLRELSQLRVRALPLRKGERRRTLLLQPAGSRPGPHGRAVDLYVAHLGGESTLLQVEPERCDAYTVLNRLGDQLHVAADVVDAHPRAAARQQARCREAAGAEADHQEALVADVEGCRHALTAASAWRGSPRPT